LDSEFALRQDLNSKANIPTAKAYDVLGQISQFTITVKDANGNVLVSGSATDPIDLLLDKAGIYQVVYYAKDSNGKYTEMTYMLSVYDETAPTLTITDSLKDEYKVGDTYPRKDYKPTKARIDELAGNKNKLGFAVIEVEKPKEETKPKKKSKE
jgi:hypothetical protein